MSSTNTALLRSLPSVKGLLFFNTVAKHLNLVRAGQELHMTQGALSRQLKALEEHLGVELFKRGPRGLSFTQEGELLYDYSRRAFDTLSTGLRRLSVDAERDTLVVSVARSFAACVLCKRVSSFAKANPWIDLRIDVHRYFADMDSSGVDISVRLGAGDWEEYQSLALTDDRIVAVCSPRLARQYEKLESSGAFTEGFLLRNGERDYWEQWRSNGNRIIDLDSIPTIHFNDSTAMLEVAKSGAGLCLTRLTLVADALADGSLKQLWKQELHDGLRYHAVCSNRTTARRAVDLFMKWLASEFVTSTGADSSIPQKRKV